MKRTTPSTVLAAAALAALAGAFPAPAQQEPSEPEAPTALFVESLDVGIVNLDVVVTDARGNPIDGLTREEFTLRVDGEPTPIDNFYVVGLGTTSTPAPAAEGAPGAPPVPLVQAEPGPSTLPAVEQELHVLVLFDNMYATPGERVRVVDDLAATFERGLGARGRASVGYYDGGIKVPLPFTSDGAAVAAAIRETATRQVRYGDDLERRYLLREIERVRFGRETASIPRRDLNQPGTGRGEDGRAADDAEELLTAINLYAEQQAVEVRRRIAALTWKVETLAGLPGRKALLYVSSGLDLHPGQALFNAWRSKFGAMGRRGLQAPAVGASNMEVAAGGPDIAEALAELILRANAGGVALYAIGTAGTGTSQGISAEHGGFELETSSTSVGSFVMDQGADVQFRANLGSGLEKMAAATGGEALTGGADYDRLAKQIEQDAGHRYSLGFRAPEGKPGASHRVEVELAGYRAKLRYRQEFVTATAARRASERTRAALLWDHPDNGLGIAADLSPAQPSEQGKKLLVLPVLVKVPFANLVLLPEAQFRRGQITIFVVAEDAAGRLSPVQSIEAPIRIPADRLDEVLHGVAGYRVGLLVRPGMHRLAIGVRDELGDVVSTLVLEHDVTAPPAET